MVSILPLYSSSPLNTLTLNTTAIQCHQFHTSDSECQVPGQQKHNRSTLSPQQSSLSLSFVERPPYHKRSHSTASWKLTQQLYGCDAPSFTSLPATPGTTTTTMPSPVSESDLEWSYLYDHPLNNNEDDRWSLVSTENAHGKRVENENVKFPAPIQLVSRYQHTLPVLTNPIAEKIRRWLPRRLSLYQSQWTLLYSLDQHGASLKTFYQLACEKGPCLLVVQDEYDNIFGAYASESIQVKSSFYGSGESFLWKRSKSTSDRLVRYEHYPWTEKNDYFIYSDKNLLGFGNGAGQFGLCLDDGFENGTSSPSLTFDNPCLSSRTQFQCIGLELWATS
ncbi:hypothetical protein [Absidia glauca]|uniref:Oxidation resistance protein 1 n=1 Tax=Absidia glauca TaxID=4829 RepID=A0A163K2Y3_ABSGL|nr:hypothetical protein [Absidia glauca]